MIALALRLLAGTISLAILIGLIGAGIAAVAFGTEGGRDLVRRQTMQLADRILGPNFRAELGDQSLTISKAGMFALAFNDVTIVDERLDRPVATADTVAVGLAILPLLSGDVDFDRLEIEGAVLDAGLVGGGGMAGDIPRMLDVALTGLDAQIARLDELEIDAIELSGMALAAPDGSRTLGHALLERVGTDGFELGAALEVAGRPVELAGSATFDPASRKLKSLEIRTAGIDAAPDDSAAASAGALDWSLDAPLQAALTVSPHGTGGARRIDLLADIGEGRLRTGNDVTPIEAIGLRLAHIEGADRISVEPSRFAFRNAGLTLSGEIWPQGGGPAHGFKLHSDDLHSKVGTGRADAKVAGLSIEGSFDPALLSVDIERLSAEAGAGGGVLQGSGRFDFASPESRLALRLAASGIDAGVLKAFWPHMLGGKARAWVLDHVRDAGNVAAASLRLDLSLDRLKQVLGPAQEPNATELQIDLDVENAAFDSIGALPAFEAAKARIEIRGPRTMIALKEARIAGFDRVAVEPSSIDFTKVSEQALKGELSLNLAGEVPQLLAIAERQPIDVAKRMGVTAVDAEGQVRLALGASFGLGEAVPRDKRLKAWSLMAILEDVTLTEPVQGRHVSAISGTVNAAPGMAVGDVEAKIDGVPATISFAMPFAPNPVGSENLKVALSLSQDQMKQLLPFVRDVVSGELTAELVKEQDVLRATVNLTEARLSLPWIGWTKGRGIPAKLDFDIAQSDGTISLDNIAIAGTGFSASGSAEADTKGLRSLSIDSLALNPDDDVSVNLQRVSNGFSIRIAGKRFDARPFLAGLKENIAGFGTTVRKRGGRQIDVGIAIDRLTGFNRQELHGFTLNYAGGRSGATAFSLTAETGTGRSVAVDMSPRGSGRAISLSADDAGALLRFSGLYDHMEGGVASLNLTGSKASGFRGPLLLQNFTLVDEPRLSSIVASSPTPESSSLSQTLGAELETERAFFDTAEVTLSYRDGALRVDDGIIRGPVFGSSFEGTVYDAKNRIDIAGSFMPAYGINRIFGAIPLVGQILGNGNEGGLIGITYHLGGAFASPTLTVNPISAIAPGIFRRIFAY